jgi:hypothetical protein
MADFPVLTENTEETAIGHEDGPGTMSTHQGILFSKMSIVARDHGEAAGTTNAFFILQPVDFTFSWTQAAILQYAVCLADAGGQFSCAMSVYVGWYKQNILPVRYTLMIA